jgi:hypothetical protein
MYTIPGPRSGDSLSQNDKVSDIRETGNLSMGGGIQVNLSLSKKFSVNTGLMYEQIGQVRQYTYTTSSFASHYEYIYGVRPSDSAYVIVDSVLHTVETKKATAVKERQKVNYLGIPLSLTLIWSRDRWQGFVTLGMQANVLLKSQYSRNSTDSLPTNPSPAGATNDIYRRFVPNLVIRIGTTYRVSNRLSLILEPVFQYTTSPIHKKEYAERQQFYSIGVVSGLRFKLYR